MANLPPVRSLVFAGGIRNTRHCKSYNRYNKKEMWRWRNIFSSWDEAAAAVMLLGYMWVIVLLLIFVV